MFRKILKWFGYFLLGGLALMGAFYIYLTMQNGEKAAERTVFAKEKNRLLVIAHRGGGGLFPENTLEAFQYSARIGVDILELDVHQTADGALVVIHDSTVERTTDGQGQVRDLTLADLKKLDAGFRFTPDAGKTFPFRGRGFTVPTLEEIFAALPAMTFNIEPKQRNASTVTALCSLIRERKMSNKTIVGSFDQTTIEGFRRQCPEVATSASPVEASKFLTLSKTRLADSYSPPMQALQVPQRLGGWQIITKEFVADANRRNLQIHVWTVNDEAEMQSLIDLGVDGIMTDYPDRLLNLLNQSTVAQ